MTQEAAAGHALRHETADAVGHSTNRARHGIEAPLALFHDVPVVAGEEFVAAIARQYDLDVFSGQLRHHEGGNGRCVAERFVEIPREVLDHLHDVQEALCRVHVERPVQKRIPGTEPEKEKPAPAEASTETGNGKEKEYPLYEPRGFDALPDEEDEEPERDEPDALPPGLSHSNYRKPYFEALLVTPADRNVWGELRNYLRRLRRAQDEFIYEPVVVGSFEDGLLAVILNGNLQAAWPGLDYLKAKGAADATLQRTASTTSRSAMPLSGRIVARGDGGRVDAQLLKIAVPGAEVNGTVAVTSDSAVAGSARSAGKARASPPRL